MNAATPTNAAAAVAILIKDFAIVAVIVYGSLFSIIFYYVAFSQI